MCVHHTPANAIVLACGSTMLCTQVLLYAHVPPAGHMQTGEWRDGDTNAPQGSSHTSWASRPNVSHTNFYSCHGRQSNFTDKGLFHVAVFHTQAEAFCTGTNTSLRASICAANLGMQADYVLTVSVPRRGIPHKNERTGLVPLRGYGWVRSLEI